MSKLSGDKKSPSAVFRFLRVVLVLGIAVALAMALIKLKPETEKKKVEKTPPSVKIMSVSPVSKAMAVEAYGTVKPRNSAKITAEVPGRVDYMNPAFVEGGRVNQGDLLIRIDQRSYELDREAGLVRVRQARTDIKTLKQDIENLKQDAVLAQANLDLARKELDRITALSKNQFASKTSLDKAEQQVLQARIQLQTITNRLSMSDTLMEQKAAALSMAEVDSGKADLAFQKTRITADFNGFILDKYTEEGEYVNPGQVLGSMYETGKLDVDVRIPFEKMKWIDREFDNGKMPAATVTIANLETARPRTWDARVARVMARIDEKTRTLPMTVEIDVPENSSGDVFELRPGTFVKCSIKGEMYDRLFVLPRYLLKGNDILYTVDGDNHLKMKPVEVLRKFEDEVYITSGLEPEDRVITSPLPGALDGMQLVVKQNGK